MKKQLSITASEELYEDQYISVRWRIESGGRPDAPTNGQYKVDISEVPEDRRAVAVLSVLNRILFQECVFGDFDGADLSVWTDVKAVTNRIISRKHTLDEYTLAFRHRLAETEIGDHIPLRCEMLAPHSKHAKNRQYMRSQGYQEIIHNPMLGDIHITTHTWRRFRERFPGRSQVWLLKILKSQNLRPVVLPEKVERHKAERYGHDAQIWTVINSNCYLTLVPGDNGIKTCVTVLHRTDDRYVVTDQRAAARYLAQRRRQTMQYRLHRAAGMA